MRRFNILLNVVACLVLLFAASCKMLKDFTPKIVAEPPPANETAVTPAADAQMAPEPGNVERHGQWPEGVRLTINKPPVATRTGPAEIVSGPDGFVPQGGEPHNGGVETPAPSPEDPFVKMIRAAADTPESKQLVEAIFQALANRPDKAIALIEQFEGGVPADKKMFVQMLKCYVNMQLGNMDKAIEEMNQVLQEMRSDMPLAIASPKFCRKVESFGKYDEFGHYVFSPGKAVILYFEPQYFICKPMGEEYAISLNAICLIIDKNGNEVWKAEKKIEHATTRYLYDLFMTRTMQVPALPDGNYTLKIMLQDMNKTDQEKPVEAEIKFEISRDI